MTTPTSPSSGDGGCSADGSPSPCSPACPCSVKIKPNKLELYVSEPNKTLTAVGNPGGGTFTWTSSDASKLKISGSGHTVKVLGLDEGDVQVKVDYSPPACGACSAQINVKVKYEIRHILVAQGIQFNNKDIDADDRIPGGELLDSGNGSDKLSAAVPFPIQISGTSATFKSVKQGVKYTIAVTTDRTEFKKKLETPGKPGTKELEYWHVIYDGHSRYGRGACFGTDDSPGENWENSSSPTGGPNGLYRMGYRFVGVPARDILHHGYTTDVISTKVAHLPPADREFKGELYPTTLKQLKNDTKAYLERHIKSKQKKKKDDPKHFPDSDLEELDELQQCLARIDSLGAQLRIVGDAKPMVQIGAPVGPHDRFWGYHSGEGPAVMLQAGWEDTVCKPMDLGATTLKCRAFSHLGCESYMHYRNVLRNKKKWKKAGNKDRFAYFTSALSVSITGPLFLYYWLTYNQFNAGKPWGPSLEDARVKANNGIKAWCRVWNRAHPGDPVAPYKIL